MLVHLLLEDAQLVADHHDLWNSDSIGMRFPAVASLTRLLLAATRWPSIPRTPW